MDMLSASPNKRDILANIDSDGDAKHANKNLMTTQTVAQLQRAKLLYGGLFWLGLVTAFMTAFYTFRATS